MKDLKDLHTHLSDIGFYTNVDVYAVTATAIGKVLGVFPQRDRWCVEFGAWDGLWGSNSRDLIVREDYSAVLIEGNRERANDLQKLYAGKSNIITRNLFVGFTAADGLDVILAKTPIPRDFDFLSVDIDGNDYHVWKAMVKFQPKFVCIEFNTTIPPAVKFTQPANPAISQGCSLAALIELGKQKNYELIAVIGVNAFFVAREYYPLFEIKDNSIESLWTKRDCVTYLFSGYDGRILLAGCQKFPWHDNFPMSATKMQVLPLVFRNHCYTQKRRILYTCLTDPLTILRRIFNRVAHLNPFARKSS